MNKQLITTYFEEFKHWLNGGNVQVYYKKDTLPRWYTDDECLECIEHESVDNFSHILRLSLSPEDVLVAIDDEYVEFRKALAEGKTIQYRNLNINVFKNWQNLENLKFNPNFEHRIKPEEPKFKVGDWVVHNGVIKRVTMTVNGLINSLDKQLAVIKKEESLELWRPKNNEYFWYKNDLVKFDKTPTNAGVLLQSIRGCSYYPSEDFKDFCEPFIGKLPSYLKELNKK